MRALLTNILFFACTTAWSQYGVQKSDSTVNTPSLPPQLVLDITKLPKPAQNALMPLYVQEWRLAQQLNDVKWDALHETIGGLAMAFAGAANVGDAARAAAGASAAMAGQPGSNFTAKNPSPDEANLPLPVQNAAKIILEISNVDSQLSAVKAQYGLQNYQTPWSHLFPDAKQLTPDQVTKILSAKLPLRFRQAFIFQSTPPLQITVNQIVSDRSFDTSKIDISNMSDADFYKLIQSLGDRCWAMYMASKRAADSNTFACLDKINKLQKAHDALVLKRSDVKVK